MELEGSVSNRIDYWLALSIIIINSN